MRTFGILGCALAALFSASCARPVQVGLMTKLEAGSVIGSSEVNAARLFAEDAARPAALEVQAFDDGWDPVRTRAAFEEARAAGIRFLITSHPSNCSLAIAEAAEAAGIMTIVTGATTDLLSGKDDLLIRVVPDVRQEQQWIAGQVAAAKPRDILVVRDVSNEAYTKPAFAYFSAALPGVKIRELPVSIDALEPEALGRAMAAAPYDLCYILVGSHKSAAGSIAQLSLAAAPEAPIMFTPWMKTPALVETAGPALVRASMPSHFPPRGRDTAVDAYTERYRQRFGYVPTAVSLEVYRVLYLLDAAMREGARTPQAMKRALLAHRTLATPFGPLALDRNGDAAADFYLLTDIAAEF